jgi:hypothetical protein
MKKLQQIIACHIVSLSMLFSASSCKKNDWDGDDPTTVVIEGVAKENQTGKPIHNAEIYVFVFTGEGGGFGPSREVIASNRTNADGEYKMEVNTTKGTDLNVVYSDDRYTGANEYKFNAGSTSHKKIDFNPYVIGHASIKFINANPSKNVTLNTSGSDGSSAGHSSSGFKYRTDVFTFPATDDAQVYLKIKRDGKVIRDTINLDIPMRDTLYLEKTF